MYRYSCLLMDSENYNSPPFSLIVSIVSWNQSTCSRNRRPSSPNPYINQYGKQRILISYEKWYKHIDSSKDFHYSHPLASSPIVLDTIRAGTLFQRHDRQFLVKAKELRDAWFLFLGLISLRNIVLTLWQAEVHETNVLRNARFIC